jgi:hypothetical protein
VGAPASGLIAEIFLQNLEQTLLTQKHHIANYCRYVNDIFIIFDFYNTDTQNIFHDFKNLHPKLQLTAELEQEHALNYLDITVMKTPTIFKTAIYRKPTFTDTIIPYNSNHPAHHKYAAIRFLFRRLNSYDLQHKEYEHELNIIHSILHNNGFPLKPHKPHPPRQTRQDDTLPPKKWAKHIHANKINKKFGIHLYKNLHKSSD